MNKPAFKGKYCALFCPLRDEELSWCHGYSGWVEKEADGFERLPECIEEFGEDDEAHEMISKESEVGIVDLQTYQTEVTMHLLKNRRR